MTSKFTLSKTLQSKLGFKTNVKINLNYDVLSRNNNLKYDDFKSHDKKIMTPSKNDKNKTSRLNYVILNRN